MPKRKGDNKASLLEKRKRSNFATFDGDNIEMRKKAPKN